MILEKTTSAGALRLHNRVVMAPMTRNRADNPGLAPTELHVQYYSQRASAGLIITEGTVVSPRATGYVNVPGIYSEAQIEGWRKVTKAVHERGGQIVVQLWHVGRITHPGLLGGQLPLAPSAINPGINVRTYEGKMESVTPQEMSLEDIRETIAQFAQAAENALEAGFDGVEIHSSNGYLFHQFFSPCSNHRSDAYGGSRENRIRFFFEVLDAVTTRIPANRVGFRLNPMLHGASGITVEEETAPTFDAIVQRANDYDLAYLHLSRPFREYDIPFFEKDVIGRYRRLYKGFLIANSHYDREGAEKELAQGRADAIAFGIPFISNPDLPERLFRNLPLAAADKATFYTSGAEGYVDYPSL
jgi:N-ethylmaleimide reductase